jgi:cell division protein FtsQ
VIAQGRVGIHARRRPRLPPRARLLLAISVVLIGLGVAVWLWVRDSPLVAIEHVTVTGETGPDASEIRFALQAAARTMTTLDVDMAALRNAVAPYPVVRDLQVSTHFPHGIRIRVIEQTPVAVAVVGDQTVPVAADGTLLRDVLASPSLPLISGRVTQAGGRVSGRDARAAVALLVAAPEQMLRRVSQVTNDPSHGLVAQLRGGPSVYFGDASRLAAKWAAASAVLADPGSAGAAYIDVTDPGRPAAGAGTDQAGAAAATSTATSGATSTATSGATSTAASGTTSTTTVTSSGPPASSSTSTTPTP